MKLLKHIEDKPLPKDVKPQLKTAARAILFDENGLIPVLFVTKFDYHKIPGGEVEQGESEKDGPLREIKEETGCTAEITEGVGKISEYRSRWNLLQTSYCYTGKIILKGRQGLTEKERSQGFKLVWLSPDDAIAQLKKDKPKNYEGKFIQERDLRFLEEVFLMKR